MKKVYSPPVSKLFDLRVEERIAADCSYLYIHVGPPNGNCTAPYVNGDNHPGGCAFLQGS